MADRQQIYEAIRRADKAGDRASVERLGRYLQEMDKKPAQKPTSFWQGVAEGVAPAAVNVARLVERTNPFANIVRMTADAVAPKQTLSGLVRGKAPERPSIANAAQAYGNAAAARSPYRGSTAGKITGEVIGTLPTAFLPGSGVVGAALQGAAGGAMLSPTDKPMDYLKSGGAGAVGGVVGQQVGKRVIAPIAERVGRTKVVRGAGQAVVNAANNAASRVTSRRVPMPPKAPRIAKPERVVSRAAPDLAEVRTNIAQAADMNLPYSLADADPRLRALGGSVSRFSPDGRALAEQNYTARAMGQADRAIDGIDSYLAPVTNIEQRGGEIRQAAQAASRPLYDDAFTRAAPVDEELAGLLNSDAGRAALAKARVIASNEGRDPNAMGFNLNDQGEVVIQEAPSFETLDLVKRGLDAHLNDFRNPITGQLDLAGNPLAGSVEGLRQRLVGKLDKLNPAYGEARAAYASQIARKNALDTGGDLARQAVPQRQFDAALAGMNDMTMPEVQRGYATAMADKVSQQRLANNPYSGVYGSPLQQGKVATLFPEGSDQFNRLYNLENEMAATRNEVLGGSQTQPRNIADQMFQGGVANDAVDMGIQAVTGGGVPGATRMLGALARYAKDRSQLGLAGAKSKADALAPQLFDTSNPRAAADYIDELLKKMAQERARKSAYQGAGGLLGVPVGSGITAGFLGSP